MWKFRALVFVGLLLVYCPPFARHLQAQGVITTVAGSTWIFRGDGSQATNAPLGELPSVAVDTAGNVYAADQLNNLIVRFSPATGVLRVVAGNGLRAFSGDGGPATNAALGAPVSVAVDGRGKVYIADVFSNRIRRVSPEGTITTVAGTGVLGFSGDGGPATSAMLRLGGFAPGGGAVDRIGNLYIADSGNHRVRKVGLDGTISTVAGNEAQGFSADGGPATNASLDTPNGVAVDVTGNLYIAVTFNHRIRRVGTDGTITTVAGGGRSFVAASRQHLDTARRGDLEGQLSVDLRIAQVNVQIPAGLSPGSTVPLVLSQNGVPSNTVTLAIK